MIFVMKSSMEGIHSASSGSLTLDTAPCQNCFLSIVALTQHLRTVLLHKHMHNVF